MDYQTCPSLAVMFFERVAENRDKPFLWAKQDGVYKSHSWTEVADRV